MKYKKIIIPSIIAVMAISMWAFIPVGGFVSYSMTADVPVKQLYEESDLVIIATYSNQKIEETWVDGAPLRSVTTVDVSEVLKGKYDSSTLEVIDYAEGVSYQNGYRMDVLLGHAVTKYQPNEEMVMFLQYILEI